jgi:predicted outer membrane repeat protein
MVVRRGHAVLLALLLVVGAVVSCDDESPVEPPTRAPRNVLVKYDGTGDYPTIRAAINASINGDTISLANGRFVGEGNRDLDFGGLRIIVRSERNNPDFCVIDCGGTETEPHRAFVFRSGETTSSVVENITIENGFGAGGGAAVACENGASPTLRSLVFRGHNNVAVTCEASSPLLEGCTFALNIAGGLEVSQGSSPVLIACTFVDNYSGGSGAAVASLSSAITMRYCLFLRNGSFFSGGAIYSASLLAEPARLDAFSCVFLDNVGGYHGGAIDIRNTEFFLEDCTFARNTAGSNGGATWVYSASSGGIHNCVFYGNDATQGSAINCGSSSSISLERSILAFNKGSAPIDCDSLLGPPVVNLACSDIHGNDVGDWIGCVEDQFANEGNLSVDPLFCNPAADDFGLQPGSPCVPPASPCGPMGVRPVECGALGVSDVSPATRPRHH